MIGFTSPTLFFQRLSCLKKRGIKFNAIYDYSPRGRRIYLIKIL